MKGNFKLFILIDFKFKIAKTYLFVKYTECRSLVRLVPVISDALIKLIIF